MLGIKAVIKALELLELRESFKYLEYAKKYNYSCFILLKRYRGV
jgi:hypothetical protein